MNERGNALVKQIKIYPLAKAGNAPEQRFVDMTDTMYGRRTLVCVMRSVGEVPRLRSG